MPTSYHLTTTIMVKLAGNALPTDQFAALSQLTVEKHASAADRVELEFDGEHPHAPSPPAIGTALTIEISDPTSSSGALIKVFDGEVVGHAVRWRAGVHQVVVEGFDHRHRLARAIQPATHQKIKLGALVNDIAQEHSLTASVPSDLSNTEFEHLAVAGSHFAVLRHIARRTGSVWTIDDRQLVFSKIGDAPSATIPIASERLIDFDLRYAPVERPASVVVRSWNQRLGEAIVGQATSAAVRPIPDGFAGSTSLTTGAAVVWRDGAADQRDAEEIAAALARRMRTSEVDARGTVDVDPRLKPGVAVTIGGVSATVNGTYVLESVVHRMGGPFQSAITEFRVGSADDSLADVVDGSAHMSGAPEGVTIGVITDSNDPEGLGRVRAKLPLLSDDLQTGWMRVAGVGGGPKRGIMFVPEVNDEVLVTFEHGDLNRPYVIGSLWNNNGDAAKTAFQPLARSSKTVERWLASRLGNRIRFVDDDDQNKAGIAIEMDLDRNGAAPKAQVFLGYKRVTIETSGRPLEIKNGNASIILDKDNITIKGQKITIDASADVEVTSKSNVNVKATANLALEATAQLTAKSKAGSTVESSGITQVKGSIVKVN